MRTRNLAYLEATSAGSCQSVNMNTRIVIIDSHQELCDRIASYFSEHRRELTVEATALTGIDGLAKIEQFRPDCLVLDLVLPGLDGIAVLERLQQLQLEPKPRVLVLSSFESETVIQNLSRLGVDYFMLKPIDLSALADRLTRMGLGLLKQNRADIRINIDPELRIAEELHYFGVPAHIQGYRYLSNAVEAVLYEDRLLGQVTKLLYPTIAEMNNTTSSRVERAMRHAISLAWKRGDSEKQAHLLGSNGMHGRSRPSNSEFIALLAHKIRLEMRGGAYMPCSRGEGDRPCPAR